MWKNERTTSQWGKFLKKRAKNEWINLWTKISGKLWTNEVLQILDYRNTGKGK